MLPLSLTLSDNKNIFNSSLEIKTSQECGETLIDRVYLFKSPNDDITFNLDLHYSFNYFFYLEVMTPNNSIVLDITIWDPESKQFDVFSRTMVSGYQEGDYDEVPFGVAVGGVHTITFTVTGTEYTNIYIRIEKGVQSLHDMANPTFIDHQLHYEVKRFSDTDQAEVLVDLKLDTAYRFYIARVSAIADLGSVEKVDLIITDPYGNVYNIYTDVILPDVGEMSWVFFGTAESGVHNYSFTLYTTEPYINVAYMISEDYDISENIDCNGTRNEDDIPPTTLNSLTSLGFILIYGGIGSVIGIVVIVGVSKRKGQNARVEQGS